MCCLLCCKHGIYCILALSFRTLLLHERIETTIPNSNSNQCIYYYLRLPRQLQFIHITHVFHCPHVFSLHWSKFIAHTVIFHPNDTFAINSRRNRNVFATHKAVNRKSGEILKNSLAKEQNIGNNNNNNQHICVPLVSLPFLNSCANTLYFPTLNPPVH